MSSDDAHPEQHLTLSTLPTDLLVSILTFLPYPALTNLQHTSHFFQSLPSTGLLSSAQKTYTTSLFAREQDLARRLDEQLAVLVSANHASSAYHRAFTPGNQPNNIHKNAVTRAERLVCYSCFSELLRERFARSQVTKKRSYGHALGWRRFCLACGVRKGFYARGTVLKESGGGWVVCLRCGRLGQKDWEAAQRRLCGECPSMKSGDDESIRTDTSEEPITGRKKLMVDANLAERARNYQETIRANRCQRCWAVDHTIRVAGVRGLTGEPLCYSCAECVA